MMEFEEAQDFSEHWDFHLEPHLRLSTVPHIADTALDGDLRDTYIENKNGSFHMQAGSFIKVWEGTDGLNPMDLAAMKNLRDPFSGEVLGSWGLAMNGGDGFFTWDTLYVPYQTPSRLPGESAPWWPRHTDLPLEAENEQLLLSSDPQYQLMSRDSLNNALKDNYGGRVQLHGDGWDFSLAYFEGAAQVPLLRPYIQGVLVEIDPKTIVQMVNPIQIQPVDYRRRSVAAGMVYTKDSWVFRAATRHEQPLGDDPLLPSWWDESVIGAEKTLTMGEQNPILSLLYSFEKRPDETQSVLASPDPFESSLMAGCRWPITDQWLAYWMGLWDLKYGSYFQRLTLQRKVGDRWTLEAGGDWYYGAPDTLLGLWKEQSRAHVAALVNF